MKSEEHIFVFKKFNTNLRFIKMRFFLLILFINTTYAFGIDWNRRILTNGCDFPGNDLTNISSADPKVCSYNCYDITECTHFTWTNFNGGTCWLKKGRVTKSDASLKDDEGAVCGVERDTHGIEWNENRWARWCDFYGNDLANATTESENCYNRCLKVKDCTHFTWTNYNGGTCWMKKGSIKRTDAFPKYDEGAMCGVIALDTPKIAWHYWHGYAWADDCHFYGNDLKSVTKKWNECRDFCFSTERCTHVTHHDQTCYLKKGTVEKSSAKQKTNSICAVIGTYPISLSGRSTRYWDCCKVVLHMYIHIPVPILYFLANMCLEGKSKCHQSSCCLFSGWQ